MSTKSEARDAADEPEAPTVHLPADHVIGSVAPHDAEALIEVDAHSGVPINAGDPMLTGEPDPKAKAEHEPEHEHEAKHRR